MKDETVLKLSATWAVVVVYTVFATQFGINGTLFWGVLFLLGGIAGVKVAMPLIASAKRAESILDPPKPPGEGG